MLGLTDVWSATRKETALRMIFILDILMEDQLQDLFSSLIKVRSGVFIRINVCLWLVIYRACCFCFVLFGKKLVHQVY